MNREAKRPSLFSARSVLVCWAVLGNGQGGGSETE